MNEQDKNKLPEQELTAEMGTPTPAPGEAPDGSRATLERLETKLVEKDRVEEKDVLSGETEKVDREIDGLVSDFLPAGNEAIQERMSGRIKEYLIEAGIEKTSYTEILTQLREFLKKNVHEVYRVVGLEDSELKNLENRIKSESKVTVLASLNLELDEMKANLDKTKDKIQRKREDLKGYTTTKGAAQGTLERKKQIETEIDELDKQRDSQGDSMRSLQRKIKVLDQIADNLGKSRKKVPPELLFTYVHLYFQKFNLKTRLLNEGAKEEEVERKTEQNEKQLLNKSRELANTEMNEIRLAAPKETKVVQGILNYVGRHKIGLKRLVDFMAQSEVVAQFPEANRDKAKEIISQLKEIKPRSIETKSKLVQWINRLAPLLPPEKTEENLQRVVSNIIATMEGALNGQKWREGVNQFEAEKIVHLTSGVRQAYEDRLAENETDIKVIMAKIEGFNKAVLDAKKRTSPTLPKELREYFNNNYWLYRAWRYLWGKTKEAVPAAGKWTLKKGWETAKKHPGKVGVGVGLALAWSLGVFPAAITLFAGYKGGKKLLPWSINKFKGLKGKKIATPTPMAPAPVANPQQ